MKKKSLGLLAGVIITLSLAACESSTDSTQITEASTAEQAEPTNPIELTDNETGDNTNENDSSRPKFNLNEDFIGIKLDGYKTELTVYNNYEGVLDYASYAEKAKDFMLDYIYNNVNPDFDDRDLQESGLHDLDWDKLQDYNYLASDWRGIHGKAYRYKFYYTENNNAIYYVVSYDPKNDIIFIENEGLNELHKILNSEDISVYAMSFYGFADEKAEAENYIDYAAEYTDFTYNIFPEYYAEININAYDDSAYSDIIEIIEKYGDYTEKKDGSGSTISYEYMIRR